jgi:ligand-binding sensor domain-containing protein
MQTLIFQPISTSDCRVRTPFPYTFRPCLLIIALLFYSGCQSQSKKQDSTQKNGNQEGPKIVHKPPAENPNQPHDPDLVSQYIRSIFQDSKGHLWFGTLGDGLVRYDTKTLTYFSKADQLDASSVHAIEEDQNGNLWLGTDQGLYKYDGQKFKNYKNEAGLQSIDIGRKSILEDKAGILWVGTSKGLYRYDPKADSNSKPCFSRLEAIPPVRIAGILEDQKGNLWIASSDQGVYRYDGKSIIRYHDIEGLGDNYAGGLAEDRAGHIWFVMKNGICKFDGKNWTKYTSQNGLGGTEFWGLIIEESGIIWVTARGYTTRFDPSGHLPLSIFTPADGLNCCVQSMYQDRSGVMWWGAGAGLYRFDGHRFYQVKIKGPW